jgi:WD40 repeat protein/uncharacterized caspase-like protein
LTLLDSLLRWCCLFNLVKGNRAAAGRAMIRRKIFWTRRAAIVACLALTSFAGLVPGHAADLDPSKMSMDEIKALEQRLTDAGCYKGAIDGVASSAALDDAIKACPDQRPFLRIETGMHTAPIRRIGVDAACSLLATASDDKTVRLWSLPDGKLQRIVRLPIGDGNAGKVYAAALSPDGRWLAAGGWDAAWDKTGKHSLTIVDLSSGAIRRFGAFESVIDKIVFSAEGRRVAVGLGDTGIRVLNSASGAELLADRDYGARVKGLAFAPDGALITSSYDGQLRRYGPDLKLTAKRASPDGKRPYDVTVDPSGRRVAVGYDNETPVSIVDVITLMPIGRAETSDVDNGDLSGVAWSRDGNTLVAGGLAGTRFQGEWHRLLRRFDSKGRHLGTDVAASDSSIMDIQSCGEGFAFAAADPSFGLLSPQGVATPLQGPRTADMRDKVGSALSVRPEASSVRFGLADREQKPVVFDLAAASLTDSPNPPSGFVTARVDGLPVTDWENDKAPKFNGTKLSLDDYEQSLSLAVRPGSSGFVLGTDSWVRGYDASGEQRWKRAGPGSAWGVDFSADGELLVVAYRDGTIRWLRWSDGEELLAFFVELQSRKWVAWTPSGYYMASAGGEDLIGWHVNRGWNQEADFFPASQFRADYNRPDIVKLVLKTRDEDEAVRQANVAAQREAAKPIAAALPPVVTITSPADGVYFSGGTIDVIYALRSPSGLPIDRLDVLADGQRVSATGFETTSAPNARGHLVVTVPRKSEELALIAYSGGLTSAPVKINLIYNGPSVPAVAAARDQRPKLYALLVGVTNYEDAELNNIHFGARDAEGLAQALERQKGGLYSDVQTKIVDYPTGADIAGEVVGQPTRDNVFKGLYWLRQAATDNDLVVVFLSGHGYRDYNDRFWFLTREAKIGELPATAISVEDLYREIAALPGKKILFIDACGVGTGLTSGTRAIPTEKFPNMDKLVNDFTTAGSGIVFYAASRGTELAFEDEAGQHGAFAEALIEALGEGKGSNADGTITADLLDHYLVERVKGLTNGRQHPIMSRPDALPDFPVAAAPLPVATIISPADGAYFSGGTIDVTYTLRSPSGRPVDTLDVLADGLKVSAAGFQPTKDANARGHLVVKVPRRSEELALVARSGGVSSAPFMINVVYDGPTAPAVPARGQEKLYMVLAGVTGYTAPGYDTIHLAADDAKSIAEAFEAQEGGPLYGHVEAKIIDAPTRDAVFDGLYWLKDKMQEEDIAVIFLSGHGYLDENQGFWFLTREANPGKLEATAIPNDHLLKLIGSIHGKKVVFLDACHAAQVLAQGAKGDSSENTPDMNKVVKEFSAAGPGLVVFGASREKESALEPRTADEDKRWKHHSAYAEALIEAIKEGKASGDDGEIMTSQLDHYLLTRVEELTENHQHPVMSRPDTLPDFPVAVARQ